MKRRDFLKGMVAGVGALVAGKAISMPAMESASGRVRNLYKIQNDGNITVSFDGEEHVIRSGDVITIGSDPIKYTVSAY